MMRSPVSFLVSAALFVAAISGASAFASPPSFVSVQRAGISKNGGVAVQMSEELSQETGEATQARIKDLVDTKPVLLFMKGSKLFPQCGFSNTACQILQTFGIEFETVDILADEAVRSGVKEFSQWPTIPQLYVAGEFVGGSDIMIEMYQSGELGEMIEKAKADMM
eukprot:scaffold9605_cov45-Attheya_sp.AAC.1